MNRVDAAYLALAPLIAWKLGRDWMRGRNRQALPSMLGAHLPRPPLAPHRARIWMHSVSVGETIGAGAVFQALRERFPEWEFVCTTRTETGQAQAMRSLGGADWHDYAPLDLSWTVRRFLEAYRPTAYLFFETEIWPNALLACARRGIPTFLVNGDVSERSCRGYRRLGFLFRKPLSSVTAFLVQSEHDASRIRALVTDAVVHVTGNVKFDNLPRPLPPDERMALRRSWGVAEDAFVVVAGSTHPGEEEPVFRGFRALREACPGARLLIAPRQPERFATVGTALGEWGAVVHPLSQGAAPRDDAILLMDRMGTLAHGYGGADLALVGGGWCEVGGHNVLEPAAHGIPVVHGPRMGGQPEAMRLLRGASVEAPVDRLAQVMIDLARDPERRHLLGQLGRDAVQGASGAARRTVEVLAGHLEATG